MLQLRSQPAATKTQRNQINNKQEKQFMLPVRMEKKGGEITQSLLPLENPSGFARSSRFSS